MNEWFKKVAARINDLLKKWGLVQKIIFFGIIAVIIAAVIIGFSVNVSPGMVNLFSIPITDESEREEIIYRLEQENVNVRVTADGFIQVPDKATARRMKNLLAEEDRIPSNINPYEFFDNINQFTITEWDKNVQLHQAMKKELELFIESIAGIDDAEVLLQIPEDSLFIEDQKETTVSVRITPTPGSDVTLNKRKIEGIARLIKLGVPGLKEENLVITDHDGIIINNFDDLTLYRDLEISEKQLGLKIKTQMQYTRDIEKHLAKVFKSDDKFSVTTVEIDFNFDKEIIETNEIIPTVSKEDDPRTPYNEGETVLNVERSSTESSEEYHGSGINPQGPPGSEGQMPSAYKDVDGLVGTWESSEVTRNMEMSTKITNSERAPWEIDRVTASVLVDGKWKLVYDEESKPRFESGTLVREYVEPTQEELDSLRRSIEGLVGYDQKRDDKVTVGHYQFDRSAEHMVEDQKYLNQQRMNTAVLYSILGVVALIIAFVVFRLISRELERRRRLREEELSRQHQAMREAALRSAEEEGVDVQMSVEERARLEMQENAINMAREHPEDVAQLIRTWLIEE